MESSILEKANIIPPDGKLLLGADIITLSEDYTEQTFVTDDLYDTVEWIKHMRSSEPRQDLVLEYDTKTVKLWAALVSSKARTDFPLIHCNLTEHPRTTLLRQMNGKWHDLEEFEELLITLRENMASESCADLIGSLRDFRVTKITSIERQKDPRTGDFSFQYSRVTPKTGKELGPSDFEPPQTVKFKVPLFEGTKDRAEFEFDFLFDYESDSGSVELKFKLKNITLAEKIKDAGKAIVTAYVSSIGLPAFWGGRAIKTHTDDWRFRRNPA